MAKKLTTEIVHKLYTPKMGKQIEGYKFAVIAKDANDWYEESNPAGRIGIVGFFNDAGEILDSSDELIHKTQRVFRSCGEFADTLIGNNEIDYIAIGK